MILADKIINLRKKNGWSQEEFAALLGVSRQSISKYEGAQSMPDMDKIVKMSKIFGVSTDYLLKDEIEEEDVAPTDENLIEKNNVKKVSMEEASDFLKEKFDSAKKIAFGVMLCILSPICLIVLSAYSNSAGLSENRATGLGLCALMLLVAGAVVIFISNGIKLKKFEYLEKEAIETEYGVDGMVKDKKEKFQNAYTRNIILGVVLCVLSVLPLFFTMALSKPDRIGAIMVGALLFMVAVGVYFIVSVAIPMGAMNQLLEEGDYTRENKNENQKIGPYVGAYWLVALVIFFVLELLLKIHDSWVVWPVAGVLFPVFRVVLKNLISHK